MRQIELTHLGKKYGKNWVLRDISARFVSGRVYGLIGENGAGKTVLLRLLCGLSAPTEGSVTCDGKILGKDMEFLSSCGILIEAPGFLPGRTGMDNLLYLDSLAHRPDEQRVRQAMTACGLDPESRKKVGDYSLGMRQRLGIAQAILDDPEILLLDEATNGLDRRGVRDMYQLIRQAREQGKLIVLASHHLEEIADLCDEVYRVEGGSLVPETELGEIS